MDTVEITVEGYFNIVVSILRSIGFVFQGNVIGGITACVALLYFLMMMFRSSIDDKQPSPFKELILIMFLGIMFVGGTSAKLTVQLTQEHNLSSYAEVQGIPYIIAFPYYVANRATNILKDETKTNMLPVELASFDDVDPLQAIAKLYYQNPPRTLLNGGNNNQGGYDLQRTINAYFEECVKVDNMLSGAPATSSISAARKANLDANFFANFEVAYEGFETTTYLTRGGSDFGTQMTCPDAHAAITNEFQGNIFNEWVQFNSDSGITNRAVQKGLQLITGAVTSGADAYDIQVGLFTARLVREGIIKSGFETELDMMIFQGQQQRLFAKLGERSMFENITKPVITIFEVLIFFLTPIYTILLALGSKGLAHIAKYFMLIIFVSLWSYMNIFIDVFTYYIIEETVNVSNGFNPLSFDEIPITMSEVESAVATAASASQSVPFLLMFLMYGGVHSLMGAMRGLTDVKANGNFGAPSVTNPANNGSRDIGNQNLTKSVQTGGENVNVRGASNDSMQSINASGTLSSASSTAAINAQQRVETATENYQTSLTNLRAATASTINSNVDSESMQVTESDVSTAITAASTSLQQSLGLDKVDADRLAAQVMGSLGGKIPLTDTGLKASLTEDGSRTLSEKASEVEAALESASRSAMSSLGLIDSSGNVISFSDADARQMTDSVSQLQSSGAALQEATTYQSTVTSTIGQGVNISASSSLNFADYQSMDTFSGADVLSSMLTRDNGEVNEEFKDFLNDRYGTTDFNELKDKGIATDVNTPSAYNIGKGTDAGVLNRVFSDFTTSQFNTGSEAGIEEKLEALRRGAENMSDQAVGDIGNQAENFANTIKRQEEQFETLIGAKDDANPTLDRNSVIGDTSGATSGTEAAADSTITANNQGIDSDDAQNRIAQIDTDTGNVVDDRLAKAGEIGDEVSNKLVNPTSGLASTGADFFSGMFKEALKDFNYGSSGEQLYDFLKDYNAEQVRTASENGTTPDLLDTAMFDKLDSVIKEMNGEANIEDVPVADLMSSYMALETINHNIDDISKYVDSDTLGRYGSLYSKLDNVFNPEGMGGKSATEQAYTLKSNEDYQTLKAISGMVANGQMEASSGVYAMRKLVGETEGYETSGFQRFFGADDKEAVRISQYDPHSIAGAGDQAAFRNQTYDLAQNADSIKSILNEQGITSKDGALDAAKTDLRDLNYSRISEEDARAADAAVTAANYAYSQRENRGDFMAGNSTVGLSENAAGEDRVQGYEQLLGEYARMLDGNSGDAAQLETKEGELEREKLLKDNLGELRQISSMYGGDVLDRYNAEASAVSIYQSGFNEPVKPKSLDDLEFTDNPKTGFREIDDSMLTNGKLMLTTGNFEPQGRRMSDGEDIGQLFYDSGSKQYMAMEYGKMKYYNENPNNL